MSDANQHSEPEHTTHFHDAAARARELLDFEGEPKVIGQWFAEARYMARAYLGLVEQYQAAHEALSEIIRRHPRGCGVIHGSRPKGWTCLDYERDATEHPEGYSEAFGSEIRAGQHRCDVCVARAAVSFPAKERDNGS